MSETEINPVIEVARAWWWERPLDLIHAKRYVEDGERHWVELTTPGPIIALAVASGNETVFEALRAELLWQRRKDNGEHVPTDLWTVLYDHQHGERIRGRLLPYVPMSLFRNTVGRGWFTFVHSCYYDAEGTVLERRLVHILRSAMPMPPPFKPLGLTVRD